MTSNEKYWAERAERRMDAYVLSAEEQARVVRRSYNQTRAYVQSEIEKILHHIGDEDSLAYEYRMKRLTALLQNTDKRIKELYGITVEDTTEFLKSIIPEAYYHTIFDIAKGTGIEPNFSAVNDKLINAIVKEPWSGKNYSKRIWSNMDKLENELRDVLTEAAMSGESIGKTSRKVAESFNTASYNAERLIRTETTYACNQAELASYEELDIAKYKFVATLDTRTSSICQELDGKIFQTEKAKAGKNLPAMHPNCRSTTIPYFEDFEPEERAARDADGNLIKVPANMTYPEWYEKYVKPKEQNKGPKKPPQPPKGKDAPKKPEPEKTPNATPTEVEIPQPDIKPDYTDTPIPKRPVEVPRPEPRPSVYEEREQNMAQINKTLHEVEESRRQLTHEMGTVVDRAGNVVQVFDGKEHSVDVGDMDLTDLIFTHNHPSGGCFSAQDIFEMIKSKLLELRASTPQGTYYSLVRTAKADPNSNELAEGFQKATGIKRAMDMVDADYKAGKITRKDMEVKGFNLYVEYMAKLGEQYLEENAIKYGYIYTKGAI